MSLRSPRPVGSPLAPDLVWSYAYGLGRIEFLDLLRRTGVGFRIDLDDQDFEQLKKASNAGRSQSIQSARSSPIAAR